MSTAVLNAMNMIRALTPPEQDELFDMMDVEYGPTDLGLDPEFVREIERRSDDIDAGRAEFVSSEELMATLRAELDRAP